jgi:hypothetical protein
VIGRLTERGNELGLEMPLFTKNPLLTWRFGGENREQVSEVEFPECGEKTARMWASIANQTVSDICSYSPNSALTRDQVVGWVETVPGGGP